MSVTPALSARAANPLNISEVNRELYRCRPGAKPGTRPLNRFGACAGLRGGAKLRAAQKPQDALAQAPGTRRLEKRAGTFRGAFSEAGPGVKETLATFPNAKALDVLLWHNGLLPR
jgi:hypothetical protein